MRRWSLAAFGCLVVAGSMSVFGGAHARADATVPNPDTLDPPTQYLYSDAIVSHERVAVTTAPTDIGQAPGVPVYIWVDYIRPNTPAGVKVPTIMDASPYFNTLGRGYRSQLKTPFDSSIPETYPLCGGCPQVPFPEWYASYFIPRGYAVALMDLRGTRNSTGCEVYGASLEARDAIAVVDWIHDQPWSNGKTGMIGGSYDGTIANGAAALYPSVGKYHNPDALAAIVPVRAIDRWYDYQFFNGVLANGQELDPELFTAALPAGDTPNSGPNGSPTYAADLAQRQACPGISQPVDVQYGPPYQDTKGPTGFWQDRDFLQYASTWHAATFFIHGLYDYNVKTMNSGQLWEALPSSVPKRLWYFNGDHADPDAPAPNIAGHLVPFEFHQMFETEVHRWFLQFLKGVEAGALTVPTVQVQRDDGHWDSYGQYPGEPTYSHDRVLHFTPSNTATDAAAPTGSVQWDDSVQGNQGVPASQSFLSAPLAADTRLSGQFQFDLNISAQGADTTIAVEIDDLPPNATAGQANENVSTNTRAFAFNYAYIRPFYRDSINPRGASYPTAGSPLVPNQQYTIHFPSTYMDYIVRAGHQLRFTIADSSPYSIATDQGNVVTMFTGGLAGVSDVRVPLADIVPPVDTPDLPGGFVVAGPGLAAVAIAGWLLRARRRRARSV